MSTSLILSAVLAAAAIVAIAVKIHDFMEGETLLKDCLDEFRLARADISELDRFWADNPNRSNSIVTLTSIPSRLPHIAATLKSLMRQTRAPARIVLNLPAFSRRENAPYAVPAYLQGLKSVQIARCEDLGPATKLIPTLLREGPAQKIIVVDDDRIYPANLVRDLDAAADGDSAAAFGMSGWVVPADLVDRPSTIWSNLWMRSPSPVRARRLGFPFAVDILQGLSGYLVRPSFFDLRGITDYAGAPPESFYVDDVWISGHCKADRFVIPSGEYNYQPKLRRRFYRATSLGLVNRGRGGNEQRHNTLVLHHFGGKWRVGGAGGRSPKG